MNSLTLMELLLYVAAQLEAAAREELDACRAGLFSRGYIVSEAACDKLEAAERRWRAHYSRWCRISAAIYR